LLTEAKALATRFGILKTKHLEHIAEVRGTDWLSALAAAPDDFVMQDRRMFSPSRKAINVLRLTADSAFTALSSSFGDSSRGAKDIDAVSLDDAVETARSYLLGGNLIDPTTRDVAPYIQRAFSHLKVWVERARNIVNSAAEAVERFTAAEARAREALAGVKPREDVPVTLPGLRLVSLPPTPSSSRASSYQDFEVRSSMQEPPPPQDDKHVTRLGDNDGLRVEGRK
jgi:hypothetical protein